MKAPGQFSDLARVQFSLAIKYLRNKALASDLWQRAS
jgi:hypothetical protein